MNEMIELCEAAAKAAAAIDPHGLDVEGLRTTAIGLQRHIDQMNVVLAKVLHEAERVRAWQGTGARNMADWLSGKTKSSYGQAKKKSKLGEAMSKSPDLEKAVSKGDVSPDAAAELHDAVTNPPDGADVGELVEAVKGASPAEAKSAAERWKEIHSEESEEAAAQRRFEKRSVRSSSPTDGLVTTTVILPVLEHRKVMNAIGHVAGQWSKDGRTSEQRLADGLIALCDAYSKGQVTGGRERPSLVITISSESMCGTSNEPGTTAQGDLIPAHIVRQMAGNALLQRVVLADSQVLDLGRTVRYATDEQYKALLVRDGGCRFPGCRIPAAWCEVDHIIPWEENGPSDLLNEWLLCSFHHHVRHEPGARTIGDADNGRIRLADGTVVDCPSNRRPAAAAA